MARKENGNCLQCGCQLPDRYKGTVRLFHDTECRNKYIVEHGAPPTKRKPKFEGY